MCWREWIQPIVAVVFTNTGRAVILMEIPRSSRCFIFGLPLAARAVATFFRLEALHPGEPAVTRSAWILAESLSIIQEAWIILDLILEKHWVFCRWIRELR